MARENTPVAHPEIKDWKERVQKEVKDSYYIKDFLPNDKVQNAGLPWLQAVEILEVEKTSETTGRILYRFPVQREYLNPAMGLHGGLSGMMFDTATSWLLALIRQPGFWMHFGTTRSLNITFMRPAAEGEMLLMETEIVHAGKRLCLLKATLMRERDRAIISTAEHQKYNTDADMPSI